MRTFISNHFFFIMLLVLLLAAVSASYARFLMSYEYLVRYEGPCDPYAQSCFRYCEDEACSEPFYYSTIERSAAVVRQLCGETVLGCTDAETCLAGEDECRVIYCEQATNGDACETLTEVDAPIVGTPESQRLNE